MYGGLRTSEIRKFSDSYIAATEPVEKLTAIILTAYPEYDR